VLVGDGLSAVTVLLCMGAATRHWLPAPPTLGWQAAAPLALLGGGLWAQAELQGWVAARSPAWGEGISPQCPQSRERGVGAEAAVTAAWH